MERKGLVVVFSPQNYLCTKWWYVKQDRSTVREKSVFLVIFCVASTPQTSRLFWLPSCSHPQSYVLIFSALILTIWSMRVTGTLCFTDLSLRATVCTCTNTWEYVLLSLWNEPKPARQCWCSCQWEAQVLSAFAFLYKQRILY